MLSTRRTGHTAAIEACDQELLQATAASLNDALALSDEQGVVLAINSAYTNLSGFTEAEVIGRSFTVIFPEAERIDAHASYRRAFESHAPSIHTANVRRADGTDRRVESRTAFVHRHDARVAMLSVIRDITAEPRFEETDRAAPTMLDLQSLESLYEAHARFSVGYAYALLGDVDEAEGIVEGALLAIWRAGVGREQNDSAARGLLSSVLQRGAGEVLRTRMRTGHTTRVGPNKPVERWWTRLQADFDPVRFLTGNGHGFNDRTPAKMELRQLRCSRDAFAATLVLLGVGLFFVRRTTMLWRSW